MSNAAQTILITGATTGIGRHAALYLARRGHKVIASGRNAAALTSLREESGGAIEVVTLDVTKQASIDAAAREVERIAGKGGIDALVNNAGYGLAAPVAEMSDADVRGQFETNVFGLLAVTRAFLPGMLARGRGRVVNVSSIGGRVTMPFFGAYNATKYAVESLSDAMRLELGPLGVKVSLVEPGPIHSNFAEKSMEGVARYRSPGSPWAPVYERADAIKAQTEKNSFSPEHTSRAIARALEAARPAARYVAPGRLAVVLWLAARLPTRLLDAVLARSFGLTTRQLGAGRAGAPALPQNSPA
jgi:short-subunit dehydrogenase